MLYAFPNTPGSKTSFEARYQNFIGGEWVAPAEGGYFENVTPVTGNPFCEIPLSTAVDVERALDAAHAARSGWAETSANKRAEVLLSIADRMEASLESLAVAETWDNGKPIRETLAADLPLAIDHFRYFAGCIRAQEGSLAEIDEHTVAYHFHEPLGVVGQIIPWNFPLLMAAWKLAPALAAGNCVVLKPAEQTPASILELVKVIGELLPPGVLNVVNGVGLEAGKPLACSSRIATLAFAGGAATGRRIMQYSCENLVPVTLDLGGKSPNIFFDDVFSGNGYFGDKTLEGFSMFALNQGEVCTSPSRALVQRSFYEQFLERALERAQAYKPGNPLDTETTVGAQVSSDQFERVLRYIEVGRAEGARILLGGQPAELPGELARGFYIRPTVFEGRNHMRVFQEKILGPVVSVTHFADEAEAVQIANDTPYVLGAGVWTHDIGRAYRMGRAIHAGRVWINCYHIYPANAAFGGYKRGGIGRESHREVLDRYQQIKNLLVSYDPKPMGLF